MSIRFRKRIKILPGLFINLSKSGLSATVGKRGSSVNLKPGKPARATTGIPGSGIYATEKITISPTLIVLLAIAAIAAWLFA